MSSNKVPGILGDLPISRVLYLENLPNNLQKDFELLNIILLQLVKASDEANLQIKNKKAEAPVIPIDKEFGKESFDRENMDDPYENFSPYLNPIFNIRAVMDNLSKSVRELRSLDGFLSVLGINITELIEMDREALIEKIKEYQSKNKEIL